MIVITCQDVRTQTGPHLNRRDDKQYINGRHHPPEYTQTGPHLNRRDDKQYKWWSSPARIYTNRSSSQEEEKKINSRVECGNFF